LTNCWKTNRVAQTAGRQAELNKLLAEEQSWTNCRQTSRVEQTAGRQLELKNLLAEEQIWTNCCRRAELDKPLTDEEQS
jgi:hypothetical protein